MTPCIHLVKYKQIIVGTIQRTEWGKKMIFRKGSLIKEKIKRECPSQQESLPSAIFPNELQKKNFNYC